MYAIVLLAVCYVFNRAASCPFLGNRAASPRIAPTRVLCRQIAIYRDAKPRLHEQAPHVLCVPCGPSTLVSPCFKHYHMRPYADLCNVALGGAITDGTPYRVA